MGEKPVLTARVSKRSMERLEDYAEREGFSKSEAADIVIRQGLDVEESDMRLVPVMSDGGTVIEDHLNGLDRQLGQIDTELESQKEELGSIKDRAQRFKEIAIGTFVTLTGFIAWSMYVLVLEPSSLISAASGGVLLVLALYYLAETHLGGFS